jgi:hypothetical protein
VQAIATMTLNPSKDKREKTTLIVAVSHQAVDVAHKRR